MKQKKFNTIVFAGGGTGGHLFPGISIAEYFHKMQPFCKIRFIGTNRGIEKKVLSKTNFSLFLLPVLGLYRVGMFKKIISLFLIPFAIIKSLYYLLLWKPDFVICSGSDNRGGCFDCCFVYNEWV